MRVESPSARPRRRRRIVVLTTLGVVVVLLLLVGAVLGGGWYYSGQLLEPANSRPGYPDTSAGGTGDADKPAVLLEQSEDTVLPGTWGLLWDGGAARVGPVEGRPDGKVRRPLIDGTAPPAGTKVRMATNIWATDPKAAVGLDFTDVRVKTELGDAPAWFVPGTSSTWVVAVHGRAGSRAEALRVLPQLHERGLPTLVVTYRNDTDEGAPASPDGLYHLGGTEWHDVDAAIAYASENGARSIVLMGWSMGGAISLQAATRARHDGRLVGIVLDSPVIDWADVVAYQGVLLRLPRIVVRGALGIMAHRWGGLVTGLHLPIDLPRLDFVARAADLSLPILILHSDDDGYVPSAPSRLLAEARPDIVTLVPFAEATHTKLWNYDPAAWNAAILAWLGTLGSAHPAIAAADESAGR